MFLNMEKINKNTLYGIILLLGTLVYLVVSSFYVPLGVTDSKWIPIIAGLVDTEYLFSSRSVSFLCAFASCFLMILSVMIILRKTRGIKFNISYTAIFMLLIIFSDNRSLYFNQIYPVALCLIWAQYCMLYGQMFIAFVLISLAGLFYAPAMWLFPVCFFLSMFSPVDMLRHILKAISGFAVPIIYILSFRYIRYDDTYEFLYKFWEEMIKLNDELLYINIPTLFLFLCILFISTHSIVKSMNKLYRQDIAVANIIKLESISFVVLGLFFVFFSHQHSVPLGILISVPAGILYSYYFSRNTDKYLSSVEIVLLICALVIVRSANFLN